jgi:hypothetical protein
VLATPWIWVSLVTVGTIGNFVSYGPLPVLVPLFVQDHLGEGADVLGFVFAGYGIGGLLGAVAVGSRQLRLTGPVAAYLGWEASAVALGMLAFAPNAALAAVALALAGATGHMAEVIWASLLQKMVPTHLLGRVVSIDWLVSLSLQPAGVALAAPAAGWLGITGAFLAGSVLSTAAMAAGISFRSVRHARQPERSLQRRGAEVGE